MEIPKNARKLAELARAQGWQVEITEGRGAIVTNKAPEGFWPVESVAVRLRSPRDHIRAYGVWAKVGDRKVTFDNGGSRVSLRSSAGAQTSHRGGPLGFKELCELVDTEGC